MTDALRYFLSRDCHHGPSRAHEGDAGLDLRVQRRLTVACGRTVLADTGVHVAVPAGHVGLVFVRSSVGAKRQVCLANGTGVIDSGYRGSIGVALHNFGRYPAVFEEGERVAQLVVVPVFGGRDEQVDRLELLGESERGAGGFGSSGRG